MTGIILIAIVVALALWGVGVYNGLVTLRNQIKNAFAQIDVQLKRRYDLIPNLVETAKAYMSHERETLEAVIAARNQAVQAQKAVETNPADAETMKKLMSAEGVLGQNLGRFTVTMEAYPDLKANTTMISLMEELTSTENKISFARQAYNDNVMEYNIRRETFPSSLIANQFGFTPAQTFEVENPTERQAVKVSFK